MPSQSSWIAAHNKNRNWRRVLFRIDCGKLLTRSGWIAYEKNQLKICSKFLVEWSRYSFVCFTVKLKWKNLNTLALFVARAGFEFESVVRVTGRLLWRNLLLLWGLLRFLDNRPICRRYGLEFDFDFTFGFQYDCVSRKQQNLKNSW
jgi:hypothetical protein